MADVRGRDLGLEVAEQVQDEVRELLFRGHTLLFQGIQLFTFVLQCP